HRVATDKELWLDNYWRKNVRAYEKGKNGAPYAWVIPAHQYRKANAADAVNDLRTQGLEIQTATAAFSGGGVNVQPGDYIVRAHGFDHPEGRHDAGDRHGARPRRHRWRGRRDHRGELG